MRLKNKAPTWYRDGKHTFAPGQVLEMSEHDAMDLLNKLPWHFEKVEKGKEEKPPRAPEVVPPAPPIIAKDPVPGSHGSILDPPRQKRRREE